MRDLYHDELDELGERVVETAGLVATAMDNATRALLDADLTTADAVLGGDRRIDELRVEIEDRAFQLIARQQPVATDLRTLIGTMHLATDLERMGDLALHVARIARWRYPASAVPPEARSVIAAMGAIANSLMQKVVDVVEGRDTVLAEAIEAEDDAMDGLRRRLFGVVLSPDWGRGTESAVDVTLLGRYYERYADHAVAVARRTVFIVTGERVRP
jgi:phosphate transport system protein